MSRKSVVILQPSYIPWRGYFHQIQLADVFVFYDDVQYDKHGWRNRNRIKTAQGGHWLTIPVSSSGCVVEKTPIKDVRITWTQTWAAKHWATLQHAYAKRTPFFSRYAGLLEGFYQKRYEYLADFTIDLTVALARELGIQHTSFVRSSELAISPACQRVDRLVSIVNELGADHYLSGPSARNYLEESKFRAAGIELEYMAYDYPEYAQLYPPYNPQVSIVDLLFMKGPDAARFIWDRSPESAVRSQIGDS